MAKRAEPGTPPAVDDKAKLKPELRKRLGTERIQVEFIIDDLVKELVIDRGVLVANGCNGCNSCS